MNVHTKGFQTVSAWSEPVTIPTYPVPPPEPHPLYLDQRVYQGSCGKVYPLPFTDRVSDRKEDRAYTGVFLENEYVRLMILPEIGGRIHVGQDKTNGYEFFYRQNVIKPALVGLAGPWISGGVEFNWPQHHRPTTFLPVDWTIERHADGAATVWLSEHEPMNRMKGMAGITLYPGRSYVEARVRLYNRTPLVQTFLWWANAGIRVHDQYQAFFPPDVTFVADHARRAMSSFPLARDYYYGVDYRSGVDLRWYKNIPVPTSYMVTKSDYDFFGGYDHARRAGIVHVANRHIAPGKKLWTWGNHESGYAWDRELTDDDGPYVELMAGVFTDNQPDFSFLHPYETRTFRQYWYPIREIGVAHNANRRAALSLRVEEGVARIGVAATEVLRGAVVRLSAGGRVRWERTADIAPDSPLLDRRAWRGPESELLLQLTGADGREILRYQPPASLPIEVPAAASEPRPPREIAEAERLYLTGLHLEQYRHATRSPEPYWEEALARDPGDSRAHTALGVRRLRQGLYEEAAAHFRAALARQTERNANPYDGEAFYHLGLALKHQDRLEDAYAAFYKAAWNYAWRAAAYTQLAALDGRRGEWEQALEHLDLALETSAASLTARGLKAAALRRLGRWAEAVAVARESRALDPLDFFAANELALLGEDRSGAPHPDEETRLDIALDYASAGLRDEASGVLDGCAGEMPCYAQAFFRKSGERPAAGTPDRLFPSRLEEIAILEHALAHFPDDARAHELLGNLLYDKQRREEAIAHWEAAAALRPGAAGVWRNLGIACYNVRRDRGRALVCYERALAAAPDDARILYEYDLLRKRLNAAPAERLEFLEARRALVDSRDDLAIERATLLNELGRHQEALDYLASRRFHPWEGGEGLVSAQFVVAHFRLGRAALREGRTAEARRHFDAARHYPENLGEGKHLLADESRLDLAQGLAWAGEHETEKAQACWRRAGVPGLEEAEAALRALDGLSKEQPADSAAPDYFATSLPDFLVFGPLPG